MSRDIGIDLGTANVLIHLRGRGIVVDEPSVIAVDKSSQEVIAVGGDAYQLLGRTSDAIDVVYPLKGGVITDYELTEALLTIFVKRVYKPRWWSRPNVLICAPTGITQIEKLSLLEAVENVVPGRILLLEETLVAAVGAGLDIDSSQASMIIDIGGGTTEFALIAKGDILSSSSLEFAGDDFDKIIQHQIRDKFRLEVGIRTAETIKKKLASAYPVKKEDVKYYPVRGKSLSDGLPKSINLNTNHIYEMLAPYFKKIAADAQATIESAQTNVMNDIIEKGVVLTGGGAMIDGLDTYLSQRLKVNVIKANDPMKCVVKGTSLLLEKIRNKTYSKDRFEEKPTTISQKIKNFWNK